MTGAVSLTSALLRFLLTIAVASMAALFMTHSCEAASGLLPDRDDVAPKVVRLSGELRVGQPVDVNVERLREWSEIAGNSPWQLVPFLNGRPLKGVYPTSVNLRLGRLQYDLAVNDDNRRVWIDALSPPTLTRAVRFSVGVEKQDPFATDFALDTSHPAQLVVLEPLLAMLALSVACLSALAFLTLAATTSLLTESCVAADGKTSVRFSLAKSQLAIWFFVTFVAFILIWLATGNYSTINVSVLSLMGISAGTAVGDSYLRSRTIDPIIDERVVMSAGRHGVSVTVEQTSVMPMAKRRSLHMRFGRLMRDLLSDGSGYSIYRFQMLAWTSVLVMVFVSSVYYYLAMPSFNPELVYLMGLSSGTYVANRVPEINRQVREAGIVGVPSSGANPGTDPDNSQ